MFSQNTTDVAKSFMMGTHTALGEASKGGADDSDDSIEDDDDDDEDNEDDMRNSKRRFGSKRGRGRDEDDDDDEEDGGRGGGRIFRKRKSKANREQLLRSKRLSHSKHIQAASENKFVPTFNVTNLGKKIESSDDDESGSGDDDEDDDGDFIVESDKETEKASSPGTLFSFGKPSAGTSNKRGHSEVAEDDGESNEENTNSKTSKFGFSSSTGKSNFGFGSTLSTESTSSSTTSKSVSTTNAEKIKTLNQGFIAHLQSQMKRSDIIDLSPCVEDYIAYMKSLK